MGKEEIRKFLIPLEVLQDIEEGREEEALEKIKLRIKVLRKEHLVLVEEDESQD